MNYDFQNIENVRIVTIGAIGLLASATVDSTPFSTDHVGQVMQLLIATVTLIKLFVKPKNTKK